MVITHRKRTQHPAVSTLRSLRSALNNWVTQMYDEASDLLDEDDPDPDPVSTIQGTLIREHAERLSDILNENVKPKKRGRPVPDGTTTDRGVNDNATTD